MSYLTQSESPPFFMAQIPPKTSEEREEQKARQGLIVKGTGPHKDPTILRQEETGGSLGTGYGEETAEQKEKREAEQEARADAGRLFMATVAKAIEDKPSPTRPAIGTTEINAWADDSNPEWEIEMERFNAGFYEMEAAALPSNQAPQNIAGEDPDWQQAVAEFDQEGEQETQWQKDVAGIEVYENGVLTTVSFAQGLESDESGAQKALAGTFAAASAPGAAVPAASPPAPPVSQDAEIAPPPLGLA